MPLLKLMRGLQKAASCPPLFMDTPAWMQAVERRRAQAAGDAGSCLAQAGIQPRRRSCAGRNPVIYAIHARKAGMTKELFPRAGRHRNPFHTLTSALLDSGFRVLFRRAGFRLLPA